LNELLPEVKRRTEIAESRAQRGGHQHAPTQAAEVGGTALALVAQRVCQEQPPVGAASAMAVRSLGPPTTMSFRLAIGPSLWQSRLQKESPTSSSMVNVITIIVHRAVRRA
jgi:hypothetical protein